MIIFSIFSYISILQPNDSINDLNSQTPDSPLNDIVLDKIINPQPATIPLLENPITKNKFNTTQFFTDYLYINTSVETIMNDTYYRRSNKTGDVEIDRIYSLDNLLHIWGFLGDYPSSIGLIGELTQKFDSILYLNASNYYEANQSAYKYGFVNSANDTGGDINTTRYLADNLVAIFPLLENYHTKELGADPVILQAINMLEQQFRLINSSEFWDDQYGGFLHSNSSTIKYADENFLAAYANILWHRYKDDTFLGYTDRAKELYINVTSVMLDKFWDDFDKGFYSQASLDWSNGGNTNKFLKTNALGMIALVEDYIETANATSLNTALTLYDKIKNKLYNDTYGYGAYESAATQQWALLNDTINLEDNAWYLMALSKLYKATSNQTFYNDAIDLFNFFENVMRDDENGGYYLSIGRINNTDKDLSSNSLLMKAYLELSEIFESTVLNGFLNDSTIISGEEMLNLTCTYKFYKEFTFYNSEVNPLPLDNPIQDANITFIIRYPNETVKEIIKPNNTDAEGNQSITLFFSDDLPDGTYSISVYTNRSFRATAFNTFYFTVSSGLTFKSNEIEGMENGIYQGETIEVNLTITSIRTNDTFLNISWEGDFFNASFKNNVNISKEADTKFGLNLTAKSDAQVGMQTITFYMNNNSKQYLTFTISILMRLSVEVLLLSYKSEIVENDTIPVSLTIKNHLSTDSQSVAIRFFGNDIASVEYTTNIETSTTRVITFDLQLNENLRIDTTSISVNVTKGGESIYSEELEISIVQDIVLESISFTSLVYQGQQAFLIIKISNNRNEPINFTLYINDIPYPTNIDKIYYGENEIICVITPTINPFDFTSKKYVVTIKDSAGNILIVENFETAIQLSVENFLIFYIAPIIIPLIIIIYFKNKEIKSRILEA